MATLPGWPLEESPFHAGERAMQERAGVRERAEMIGRHGLRLEMPEQHRRFFPQLPFLVLGATDAAGQLQATLLSGPPGFVSSPSPTRLDVCALPRAGDPLAGALQPGDDVGLLGIELPTRRRNRANGRIASSDGDGFVVDVTQSFGNCPKYIQRREIAAELPAVPADAAPTRHSARLDAGAIAQIRAADTFFVASRAATGGRSGGTDVSHRGGLPGFVQVDPDRGVLTWPDYIGNMMFNTLGNLTVDGRAALVFPDFESGDLLHVNGIAEIVWDGPELAATPRAQRLVRLHVEHVLHRPAALRARWRLLDRAPELTLTPALAR